MSEHADEPPELLRIHPTQPDTTNIEASMAVEPENATTCNDYDENPEERAH